VSTYLYRLNYPITDDSLLISQVIAQATLVFPEMAQRRGIRITGAVKAWIDEDNAVCEAEAEPIPGRRVKLADLYGARVEEFSRDGLNDRQISDVLHISPSAVQRIRAELGLPAHHHREALT
jgi:hypothetical protein